MSKRLLEQLQRAHERRWNPTRERQARRRRIKTLFGLSTSLPRCLLLDAARLRKHRALLDTKRFRAVWAGRHGRDPIDGHGFTRQPYALWGELAPPKREHHPRHVEFRRSRLDEDIPF